MPENISYIKISIILYVRIHHKSINIPVYPEKTIENKEKALSKISYTSKIKLPNKTFGQHWPHGKMSLEKKC